MKTSPCVRSPLNGSRGPIRVLLALLLVMPFAALHGEEEEEEKHGTWLKRDDGRELLFYLEDNLFHLEFYGEEREPENPDVDRAAVHYNPPMRGRESVILRPDERSGSYLTSPRRIPKPHVLQVILVLVTNEDDYETETFSFRHNPEEEK